MTNNLNDVASGVIEVAAGTSAADIEALIRTAPAGATIQLAAGSYYFTSTVEVGRSDIAIVGAGQGQTIITLAASMNGDPAFQIGSPLFSETMSQTMAVSGDIAAGSTTLTLASGSVAVGDVLWIEAENTAELFAEIGDTLWQRDKPLRTAMVVVTAVDGDTVTLGGSVDFDMPADITTVQIIEVVSNVTLSGMTLQGDFGTADASDFSNTIRSEDDGMMILVNATVDVSLSELELLDMGSNGIVLGRSITPDVDDIYISGAHNKGNSGNGYGIWIRDVYDGNFDGLEIYDTRHAVLFASYTSASGNEVHVISTNRDINFHGGLDTGNTVIVDNSIRDGEEQGYLGTVVFFNEGERYGAPTDADANTVLFTNVLGTVRADTVHATDEGATIYTFSSADEVWGGEGSDYIDLGTGTDRVHASGGYDIIIGGSGVDTLVVDGNAGCGLVYDEDGQTFMLNRGGLTVLEGVEYIEYDDATVEMVAQATTRHDGSEGYNRAYVTASAVMGTDLEAMTARDVGDIDILGNELANNVIGNNFDNQIYLRAGDDRSFGGRGNDYMDGGSGNDYLLAGSGDDTLVGGDGDDILIGRHGADVFVASGGFNLVDDFNYRQGDTLVIGDLDMEAVLDCVLEHYVDGTNSELTMTQTSDGLTLTDAEAASLTLAGITALELLEQFDLI